MNGPACFCQCDKPANCSSNPYFCKCLLPLHPLKFLAKQRERWTEMIWNQLSKWNWKAIRFSSICPNSCWFPQVGERSYISHMSYQLRFWLQDIHHISDIKWLVSSIQTISSEITLNSEIACSPRHGQRTSDATTNPLYMDLVNVKRFFDEGGSQGHAAYEICM